MECARDVQCTTLTKPLPFALVVLAGGSIGDFTLGDARACFGLASKISPLGSTFNFDADVKISTARHQCENRLLRDFTACMGW